MYGVGCVGGGSGSGSSEQPAPLDGAAMLVGDHTLETCLGSCLLPLSETIMGTLRSNHCVLKLHPLPKAPERGGILLSAMWVQVRMTRAGRCFFFSTDLRASRGVSRAVFTGTVSFSVPVCQLHCIHLHCPTVRVASGWGERSRCRSPTAPRGCEEGPKRSPSQGPTSRVRRKEHVIPATCLV